MPEFIEMLLTTPVIFRHNDHKFDRESAILLLEIFNDQPEQPLLFRTDSELFDKLNEVVQNADPEDLEIAIFAVSDPEEKSWLKSYLIDYHFGNDTSRY